MSNFDNNGLGDGGLQKSKEKYSLVTEETITNFLKDLIYSGDLKKTMTEEEKAADAFYKEWEDSHPLTDAPEGWEAKRRAQLNKTVRSGVYDISMPGMSMWTGKGGYIDYLIALEKSAKRYK